MSRKGTVSVGGVEGIRKRKKREKTMREKHINSGGIKKRGENEWVTNGERERGREIDRNRIDVSESEKDKVTKEIREKY